ncbi:DUF7220 family protein [Tenacibaculum caenipelagi]|uniref:Uncharacterized protein n=1 Tax=Tenacibaculum caenipelagi TaxID=1325435 RepID=A0A4R6THX6_9FLAO|nr:hypothetical protein DFQ07_0551 [Tenacibaculum caenipelagi]
MIQTKKQSLIESLINVSIGFIITIISLNIIFPILGIKSNPEKNIVLTIYFTILSIIRNYIIRRFFNKKSRTS